MFLTLLAIVAIGAEPETITTEVLTSPPIAIGRWAATMYYDTEQYGLVDGQIPEEHNDKLQKYDDPVPGLRISASMVYIRHNEGLFRAELDNIFVQTREDRIVKVSLVFRSEDELRCLHFVPAGSGMVVYAIRLDVQDDGVHEHEVCRYFMRRVE